MFYFQAYLIVLHGRFLENIFFTIYIHNYAFIFYLRPIYSLGLVSFKKITQF